MDVAARVLLTEHTWPPFPTALLDHLAVLERETYYLANCDGSTVARVDVKGHLAPCPADLRDAWPDAIGAGILTLDFALYEERTNALLVVSRARKLLVVPASRQALVRDAERALAHFGTPLEQL
jgi:hypothetical protein